MDVKDGRFLAHLTSKPERNKANTELVSELSKLFGQRVSLISGQKSKIKKLKIDKLTKEEVMQILAGIA